MEGKSGELSVLATDARDSRTSPWSRGGVRPASRVSYNNDGQIPARQPGSGEAKAGFCYANPEQSTQGAIFGVPV